MQISVRTIARDGLRLLNFFFTGRRASQLVVSLLVQLTSFLSIVNKSIHKNLASLKSL